MNDQERFDYAVVAIGLNYFVCTEGANSNRELACTWLCYLLG